MGEGEEKGVVIAIPEGIPSILKQFHIVMHHHLFPLCGHEHVIILKEGSNTMSLRPYKYMQFQKDEIKRLIRRCWHLTSLCLLLARSRVSCC